METQMNTKIKTALLTVAALAMTAGVSVAAPAKHNHGYGRPGVSVKIVKKQGLNGFERAQIARSAANLRAVKARAWRDGKLTFAERMQINSAERRHAALVARSYRS
jgi:ribosomal protein L6P/L9E